MNNMELKPDLGMGRKAMCLRCVVLAGVCLLTVGSQALAEDKLPTGEEVLDRYVEVTGGKAAYEKFHNTVIKTKLEMVGMGMTGSMTVYSSKPNKMYSVFEAEAFGRIEEGYDGTVAWQMNPMMGPRIKEGAEKMMTQRQSLFNSDINWHQIYKKAECVGLETEDGVELYKVEMTPKEGEIETRFYDKKTGLLVRSEMMIDTQMGEMNIKVMMSDYKKVDGVLMPHKMLQDMGMQKIAIEIESLKHNIDMPKDRFDLPADIKELLEEAKLDDAKKDDAKKEETKKAESK